MVGTDQFAASGVDYSFFALNAGVLMFDNNDFDRAGMLCGEVIKWKLSKQQQFDNNRVNSAQSTFNDVL